MKYMTFVSLLYCLEHIANPLKAINEWLRIIKNDGYIITSMVPEHSDFSGTIDAII